MSTHFWQRSYHRRKVVAKSSAATVLLTPSQMVLEVVLGHVVASQLLLKLGEQEKVGWGQVR